MINWIAPHGNFSRWSSQLNMLLYCTWLFTQKWKLIAVLFVKYFKHYTDNEFRLNQYWGQDLEIEWNAFWRNKYVCNFILHKNTSIFQVGYQGKKIWHLFYCMVLYCCICCFRLCYVMSEWIIYNDYWSNILQYILLS